MTRAFWAGPVLAGACGAVLAPHLPFEAVVTAALTVWCATWWVLEPIPIPVTSLLPFVVLPLAGVIGHKEVAASYGHTLILLLMGGFMLSTAMERSGAHRRVAVTVVGWVGGGRKRVVLGFMLATAACSMWVANTATCLMMLPVALAVIEQDDDPEGTLGPVLLLALAYAANVGGMATPIGTPPNLLFLSVYEETTGKGVGFVEWMGFAMPVVAVMLPVIWLWLTRRIPSGGHFTVPSLPPATARERRVLWVFLLTAVAWVTRTLPFGGWSGLVEAGVDPVPPLAHAGDATVALGAVVAMFALPDGDRDGGRLLDWDAVTAIPWGLLLLFGGGLAIAKAFGTSGLSDAIGATLSSTASWPTAVVVGVICVAVSLLTEVTSNTATTALMMPILASAAIAAGIAPAILMLPACLSASCAFMLPMATGPNAIVYGSGRVDMTRMIREGAVLNVIGAGVVAATVTALLG